MFITIGSSCDKIGHAGPLLSLSACSNWPTILFSRDEFKRPRESSIGERRVQSAIELLMQEPHCRGCLSIGLSAVSLVGKTKRLCCCHCGKGTSASFKVARLLVLDLLLVPSLRSTRPSGRKGKRKMPVEIVWFYTLAFCVDLWGLAIA